LNCCRYQKHPTMTSLRSAIFQPCRSRKNQ